MDPQTLRARIEAYEAWEARLQQTLADYRHRRTAYRRFFLGLGVVGVSLFALGVYPGIYGVICAGFISGGGLWMYRTRLWEIETEIAETRGELVALRRRADAMVQPMP